MTLSWLPGDTIHSSLVVALAAIMGIAPAMARTRILWNEPGRPVLAGRTMDWPASIEPVLTMLPRGLVHDGGKLGQATVVTASPLRWTSITRPRDRSVAGWPLDADALRRHVRRGF